MKFRTAFSSVALIVGAGLFLWSLMGIFAVRQAVATVLDADGEYVAISFRTERGEQVTTSTKAWKIEERRVPFAVRDQFSIRYDAGDPQAVIRGLPVSDERGVTGLVGLLLLVAGTWTRWGGAPWDSYGTLPPPGWWD